MSNENICAKLGCGYWSDGARSEGGSLAGYGCQKFTVALHCPVSMVRDYDVNQYAIFGDRGLAPIHFDAAQACCPDPSVRLKALEGWPMESLERIAIRDERTGGNMAAKTEAAIANLKIGGGDDD